VIAGAEAREAAGAATFHVSPISDAGGSLVPPARYQAGDVVEIAAYRARHPDFVPTLHVEAVPLDALLDARSVVKIDVEGAETPVLRSGERALQKGLVDLMVVEVQRDTVDDVAGFLDYVGFDCFLYGRRLPVKPGQAPSLSYRVANTLCLRRGSWAHGQVDFL
jgi:FkbM family methyltransferase